MSINFTCPHCGHRTMVAPQFAGSSGPCAQCGQLINIPFATGAAAPAASASNRTILFIIGVVLLIIGSLVGLAFYLVNSAVDKFADAMGNMSTEMSSQLWVEMNEDDAAALDEVGQAITTYFDDNGVYPPAVAGPEGLPIERQASWLVAIRPYISISEEFYGLDTFDPSLPIDVAQNEEFADQTMYVYQSSRDFSLGAVTNWIGIGGVGTNSPSLPISDPAVGFFGFNRQTSAADVTDGLSNTMMVASSFHRSGSWSRGGSSTVRGLDSDNTPYIGMNRQFGDDFGATLLFADGSVHFANSTMDAKVFEAAATIHGGDTVDFSAAGFRSAY
ncbi:MAG: DUF1559 domain-containing protein [Pirellulales bacterium]|nr:DUF1559 domain-containing protein [Pirellulales bacterium]